MQIAEGVYVACNPIATHLLSLNCYLLADGDDSYIVDTGWPPEVSLELHGRAPKYDGWDMLMSLFDEAHRDPHQLTGIILTHTHQDHIGYMNRLQEYTGAKLLLSEQEAQEYRLLTEAELFPENRVIGWYKRDGVPDDFIGELQWLCTNYASLPLTGYQAIDDGDVIRVGRMKWEVIWTPGHSWGHCCLWEREQGLILTGDHILAHDTPVITAFPSLYSLRRNPLGAYKWSLKRMAAVDAVLGLPAHGRLMPDFQQLIQAQLNHHDQRYDDVIHVLESGEKDAYTIACEIPFVGRSKTLRDLDSMNRGLAFFEAVSHLHSLEARGIVQQEDRDGTFKWHLTGIEQPLPDDVDPRFT